MAVENISLLWEFSTGKQWRHDRAKGLSQGRILYPCLTDVPLSCTEIFQSVHLMVGLKQYKIKSVLSVGGKTVMNV